MSVDFDEIKRRFFSCIHFRTLICHKTTKKKLFVLSAGFSYFLFLLLSVDTIHFGHLTMSLKIADWNDKLFYLRHTYTQTTVKSLDSECAKQSTFAFAKIGRDRFKALRMKWRENEERVDRDNGISMQFNCILKNVNKNSKIMAVLVEAIERIHHFFFFLQATTRTMLYENVTDQRTFINWRTKCNFFSFLSLNCRFDRVISSIFDLSKFVRMNRFRCCARARVHHKNFCVVMRDCQTKSNIDFKPFALCQLNRCIVIYPMFSRLQMQKEN